MRASMIGATIGAVLGIALVVLHPTGSYVVEEIIGICAVLLGAVVGAELDR